MAGILFWVNNTTEPDSTSGSLGSYWHNVKDFGAKGDGVTDDTAAIQACIDSISNIVTGALGTVYFPRGTYRTSAPIRLPLSNGYSGIHLVGDGDASHIIGNIQGYIIDYYDPNYQDYFNQSTKIEFLKITNESTTLWTGTVTGVGCIRLASTVSTAVRSCTLTGLLGIVYNSNDLFAWRSRLVSGVHNPSDLTALHAISGTLSVTINGTTFSGTVNFSASASYEAAAAQMQTALTDGAGHNLFEQIFFDDGGFSGGRSFVIMSMLPLSSSSIAYATGTAAAALKLTNGTAAQILQTGGGVCNKPATSTGFWAQGNRGATCWAFPFEIMDCTFLPVSGSIVTGSIAIVTGNQGVISNVVIRGYDIGIATQGPGICLLGGTISECNYGNKGVDQFGDIRGPGLTVQGTQFINNNIIGLSGEGGVVAIGVQVVGNGGQYGIYTQGGGVSAFSVYNSCVVSGSFSVAGIAIDDFPTEHSIEARYSTFIGCSASNSGSGVRGG